MKAPPPLLKAAMVGVVHPSAQPPESHFVVTSGAVPEGGIRWREGERHSSPFGVYACLRQTFHTEEAVTCRVCGAPSLTVPAGSIADTKPGCTQIVQSVVTVCAPYDAMIGAVLLDFANLQVSPGLAFASLDDRGLLHHHAPYAVVEQAAREKKIGRWQFEDVWNPVILPGRSGARVETTP